VLLVEDVTPDDDVLVAPEVLPLASPEDDALLASATTPALPLELDVRPLLELPIKPDVLLPEVLAPDEVPASIAVGPFGSSSFKPRMLAHAVSPPARARTPSRVFRPLFCIAEAYAYTRFAPTQFIGLRRP
jgi:hypothetical protein